MRALTGLTAVLVTLLAGPAAAQTSDSISQAIRQAWDDAKGNLRQSAELIPEADLGFKPTEQVRTFGQILAHVAGANYVFCSAAKAEKSPFTEEHFEKTAKTKAEIAKAVNDSIAYCDAAFKALTDKSAAESIAMPFGMGAEGLGARGQHRTRAGTLRESRDVFPDQGHGPSVEPSLSAIGVTSQLRTATLHRRRLLVGFNAEKGKDAETPRLSLN